MTTMSLELGKVADNFLLQSARDRCCSAGASLDSQRLDKHAGCFRRAWPGREATTTPVQMPRRRRPQGWPEATAAMSGEPELPRQLEKQPALSAAPAAVAIAPRTLERKPFGIMMRIGSVSGRQIVTLERAPKVTSLNADDRIRLRVERLTAAEHFDCDRIGLDAIAMSRQCFLNYMAEEAVLATGGLEVCTIEDQGKLCATILWGERMLPPSGWFRPDHLGSLT